MKPPSHTRIDHDVDAAADSIAAMSALAPHAVVRDAGETHVGHDGVAASWYAATANQRHAAEPCEIMQQHGRTILRARVTGPSVGNLAFAFQRADARNAAPEIGA